MRFILPTGSKHNFIATLTTQYHRNTPFEIKKGGLWAADNSAFTKGFSPDTFFPWLDNMRTYRKQCLFVVCPDSVGNAAETIELWHEWSWCLHDWPLAFVAQDGQEDIDFPIGFTTLFIGGSTEWKESQAAIDCIKRAQRLRKHIHIGRVNWQRRYKLFSVLDGSENFTCDGTRARFEGIEKTKKAWSEYQAQRPLITI